jgi:hypothetical protein
VEQLADWHEADSKPEGEAGAPVVQGGRVVIEQRQDGRVVRRVIAPQNAQLLMLRDYREKLRTKFRELLTEEQREGYDAELTARDEFRKQADAECLVGVIDQALGLQPRQREELMKAIMHWPDKDDLYISYYFQNQGFLPPIPDQFMVSSLTPEQLSIYRQTPKSSIRLEQIQRAPQEAFGE